MPGGGGTKSRTRAAGGGGRDVSVGRRGGRNTTHQAKAHGRGNSLEPGGLMMEPDGTGIAEIDAMDGFHQQTALFDKGELLGELAELQAEKVSDTRAAVEVEEGPKGCRLIVVAGPDLGLEWAFKQPEITIGRAGENDIDFSDIAVSRNHARIAREGNSFYLTDLGSDNGTLLNGVRVEHEALSSGDEIIIGARTLRFVELNEAPATAAAHPIVEPEVGEPIMLSSAQVVAIEDKKLGKSQIDVKVLDGDGPSPADEAVEPPEPSASGGGATKRLALVAVGALAVVGGLSFLGYQVYRRVDAQRQNEVETRVRTEFLQAVEMVRVRRFGDAIVMLDRALAERPEHTRAKDYREHAEREVQVWEVLEAARALAAESRWDEAMSKIEPVARGNEGGSEAPLIETAWAPEIAALIALCKKAIAEGQVEEARTAFEADQRELALDLLARALEDYPNLAAARELRERIEAAKAPPPKAVEVVKPKTPPELERAVALYKADRVPQAIDAAEAAGGPSAVKYIERMRDMMRMQADLAAADRQKAAADVVRVAPDALKLDASIALGEGEIRARIKEYYANALYLKGLEAYQDGDYGKSFQLLNQALRASPGHRLSENRIADMQGKARELYYQGYALKETNAAETRRIFRQIQQMTRPSNQFHQWAAKWLAGNGG